MMMTRLSLQPKFLFSQQTMKRDENQERLEKNEAENGAVIMKQDYCWSRTKREDVDDEGLKCEG